MSVPYQQNNKSKGVTQMNGIFVSAFFGLLYAWTILSLARRLGWSSQLIARHRNGDGTVHYTVFGGGYALAFPVAEFLIMYFTLPGTLIHAAAAHFFWARLWIAAPLFIAVFGERLLLQRTVDVRCSEVHVDADRPDQSEMIGHELCRYLLLMSILGVFPLLGLGVILVMFFPWFWSLQIGSWLMDYGFLPFYLALFLPLPRLLRNAIGWNFNLVTLPGEVTGKVIVAMLTGMNVVINEHDGDC